MLALSGIILRNRVRRLYLTGSFGTMYTGQNCFLFFFLRSSGKYCRAGGMIHAHGMQCPAGTACLIIRGVKASQLLRVYIRALYIQRDVQPGRARTSGGCQVKRLFQTIADTKRVNDHLTVLGHAVNRFDNIEFLVSHRADAHAGPAGGRVITNLTG